MSVKPTPPVSSAVTDVAVAEPENTPKTTRQLYTRWDTFGKAGLGVTRIICDCLPGHPADEACLKLR